MESPSDRLRRAREEKGYRSAAQAAEEMGVGSSTYRHHENGTRDFSPEAARRYARKLGVAPEWLLYGKRASAKTIPLVGYIGAGAEFYAIDDHGKGGGLEEIEAPPGCPSNAVAVAVRGDSMFPTYFANDILIYAERNPDIEEFLNRRPCICGLADGRILVKTPTRGSAPGLYSLISYNAPPINDVVIEWCAKIKWTEQR